MRIGEIQEIGERKVATPPLPVRAPVGPQEPVVPAPVRRKEPA